MGPCTDDCGRRNRPLARNPHPDQSISATLDGMAVSSDRHLKSVAVVVSHIWVNKASRSSFGRTPLGLDRDTNGRARPPNSNEPNPGVGVRVVIRRKNGSNLDDSAPVLRNVELESPKAAGLDRLWLNAGS